MSSKSADSSIINETAFALAAGVVSSEADWPSAADSMLTLTVAISVAKLFIISFSESSCARHSDAREASCSSTFFCSAASVSFIAVTRLLRLSSEDDLDTVRCGASLSFADIGCARWLIRSVAALSFLNLATEPYLVIAALAVGNHERRHATPSFCTNLRNLKCPPRRQRNVRDAKRALCGL